MTTMKDCDGKIIHEGELIRIIGHPDLISSVDYWVVFDCLVYGSFIEFVLKNCVTNEIKIVSQKNIQRTY